jgi:hypothetical protein
MPDQFIENNVEFERKWHRFEQVVWVVLIAMLTAVCLGYFGRGPRAKRTAVAADGSLSVAYDRVMRAHSQSEVELILESNATVAPQTAVRLGGAWMTAVPVQQMMPPASSTTASRDSATFQFEAELGKPARIRMVQRAVTPGRFRSTASIPGRADVTIEQIVLP